MRDDWLVQSSERVSQSPYAEIKGGEYHVEYRSMKAEARDYPHPPYSFLVAL